MQCMACFRRGMPVHKRASLEVEVERAGMHRSSSEGRGDRSLQFALETKEARSGYIPGLPA